MTDEQTTTAPGIEKRQFLNQSGGWEGVVVINGKGEETGVSIAHGDRVWLSEAEVILTAEAPQRPEDNPFEEQTRTRVNPETGIREDFKVRPLVPVTDKRYVPGSERYIPPANPAALSNDVAARAATSEEQVTVIEEEARVEREEAVTAPPVPPRAREAVEGSLSGAEAAPSAPAEEPPAPAALGGENTPPEEAPVTPASQTAPPADETAATAPAGVGEETGAAVPPSQPPVEGEYAQAEEVGTPNAAAAGPPAPWSPGSSS